MNYNVTTCYFCRGLMSYKQLRESVYWLPDMTYEERLWAVYEGFEHRFAHKGCWNCLKEKKRELIRITSFKGQEPRSADQLV